MHNPERRRAERRGRRAELYAKILLTLKGYHIDHMRYKTKAGEIDIIAHKKDVLVFVEVKARKTLEAAELSLYPKMQKRIEIAGEIYVSRTPKVQTFSIRYDAVFILPGLWGLPKLIHQSDAWRAW